MSRNVVMMTALLALACQGQEPDEVVVHQALDPRECAKTDNDLIRLKLEPNCAGCHGAGTSAPYFASAEAFEDLLVRNPKYVVPGDPDASELVRLLEGTGMGTYTQMPTAGPPFAQLSEEQRQISIEEVRAWVTDLKSVSLDETPDRDAPTTRRLGANEIQALMLDQLGLTMKDDFHGSMGTNHQSPVMSLKGPMPLYATDAVPGITGSRRTSTVQRWSALGGANWAARKPRSYDVSATFLQTMTQVSQAWCWYAVKKPDNKALFRHATPTTGSQEDAQAVQDNIRYLHLHMLGLPAQDADVTRIYDNVFRAHEPEGTQAAWVAVCSFMIRHPLWLSL